MQIFIKAAHNGKMIAMEVQPSDTIDRVREKLAEDGLSAGRLFFGEKPLSNGSSTLLDLNIQADSILLVVNQIHVRLPGDDSGQTVMITLQDSMSVAMVQSQLTDNYELSYEGLVLSPEKTLESYSLPPNPTLTASLPLTAAKTINPKGRCSQNGCADRAIKIVGECRYCAQHYCGKHRLPESHACENLQGCRQQSYEKNSSKLMGEKCVADKV